MEPFDCELIRGGWPAQPVNTVSSLAFVVAGVWLWRRGSRVAGAVFVGVGAGSILFHGSPGRVSSIVHDVFVVSLAGVTIAAAIRHWVRRTVSWHWLLLLGVAGVVWAMSRTGSVLCDPASALQGHALWHVLSAAALAGVVVGRRSRPEPLP